MSAVLIPVDQPQPPEQAAKTAVVNIITVIREAIKEEGENLAAEWAESAGAPSANIFMQDRAEEVLAQYLAGFITRMAPHAKQFTDEHASAYLDIPPAANDPVIP